MVIKQVKNNDVKYLKELIVKASKNYSIKNKMVLQREEYENLVNKVIGGYANKKMEIVNDKDLTRAFRDLGYIVSD